MLTLGEIARSEIPGDLTDVDMSIPVGEVTDLHPSYGKKMSAVVSTGVWMGCRVAIECKFSGGSIMTLETAKMLRAALDVAISHVGGT